MATRDKSTFVLIIFILCGLVIGGLIGQLTQGVSWLSWLSYGQSFGLTDPVSLDLGVVNLSFAIMFNINIISTNVLLSLVAICYLHFILRIFII